MIELIGAVLMAFYSPAQIAGDTNLVGQYVETVGIVDHVESDGLSGSSFLVVLMGDVRVRIVKSDLIDGVRGLKEVKIKKDREGKSTIWLRGKGGLSENRVFAPGQCYVVRGVVKKELSKIVIEKVDIGGLKISL